MLHKTVLITGSAHGIGKAIAEIFAEHKNYYRIILNYFNSKKEAESLADKLRSKDCDAIAIQADVSNFDSVQHMMLKAGKFSSRIDILINNAGVKSVGFFCDTSSEELSNAFSVNVRGTLNCCKAVLPSMLKRHSGKIVNISSVLGIFGASLEVAYSASKAAVIGFTKALAKEVGPSGINVNSVAPGLIATRMNNNLTNKELENLKNRTSLGRIGSTRDVAETVLFLASEKSNFITGQTICVDGGLII